MSIHDEERSRYETYSVKHADEEYRKRLAVLYPCWHRFNQEFLYGRLREPHLGFGRTAHRSLGHCTKTTVNGGMLLILLNEGLVFGTNRNWVVNSWPSAKGTGLFIEDFLERLTVRQYVLEFHQAEEAGYDGFGSLFAAEASRISLAMGLAPVVARNRTSESYHLARFWPHNVLLEKDPYRYGNDVTQDLLDLAAGRHDALQHGPLPPSLGTWELILHYLANGRHDRLLKMAISQVDRLQDARMRRLPVMRRCEAGKEDVNGEPLGEVAFDPRWLAWNNGTVIKIAQGLYEARMFAELPILADALEEAGCGDGRILRHLRYSMEHTRRCWVLTRLLEETAR